jgi:hypothetical protein
VVRRWRRRRHATQRARLADDARRTVGLMAAMLADAERARADVPAGVVACLTVWRSWAGRLAEWAKGGEQLVLVLNRLLEAEERLAQREPPADPR